MKQTIDYLVGRHHITKYQLINDSITSALRNYIAEILIYSFAKISLKELWQIKVLTLIIFSRRHPEIISGCQFVNHHSILILVPNNWFGCCKMSIKTNRLNTVAIFVIVSCFSSKKGFFQAERL